MRQNETENIPDERTNKRINDRMINSTILYRLNLEMFHDLYSYLVDSIEPFFPCRAVAEPPQGVESI